MNNEIQHQTTVNIQEKANLIWAIADKIFGVYKPHEYGNVILPMCVIKRFEDTLVPTKEKVLATNKKLDEDEIVVKKGFWESAAKQKFYNLSPFKVGLSNKHTPLCMAEATLNVGYSTKMPQVRKKRRKAS